MPYQAITRAQLRQQLQDRYEAVPFWTDTDANRYLNEALRTWNLLTGRWHSRLVLETTPGQREVAIPTTLLYRTRVEWNGLPVDSTGRTDLNEGRPRWRSETTASGGDVPTKVTCWAPVSLRLIYLWPADATGHNSLVLDGVASTPVLTTDDQYVDLADADLSALVNYALHVALLKKGGPWWQAALGYFREFLEAAAAENSLIVTSAVYREVMGWDFRAFKPLSGVSTASEGLVRLAPGAAPDEG